MAVERSDWNGLLDGRTDPQAPLVVELPLAASPAGGSGTFLAEASDNRRWWIKPQNNLQGPQVIVTDYVVASAGRLIGAPVCEVAIVEVPEEIVGWEFRASARLEAGFAHASLAVDNVQEARTLEYRDRNENVRRHAGVFALYDWCWGGDDQWLYCEAQDRKLYSHDHGWYLPETGPDWSEEALLAHVDDAHLPDYSTPGLDSTELGELTDRLNAPLRKRLVGMLMTVPTSWPVADSDLEALGFFLERRAPAVAQRLNAMTGGTP